MNTLEKLLLLSNVKDDKTHETTEEFIEKVDSIFAEIDKFYAESLQAPSGTLQKSTVQSYLEQQINDLFNNSEKLPLNAIRNVYSTQICSLYTELKNLPEEQKDAETHTLLSMVKNEALAFCIQHDIKTQNKGNYTPGNTHYIQCKHYLEQLVRTFNIAPHLLFALEKEADGIRQTIGENCAIPENLAYLEDVKNIIKGVEYVA